jgi:hypothetical protein
MQLIDEIIGLLSSEQASLTDVLLKTKILLHKIGQKDLVEWVNHELNGYPQSVELPAYRILRCEIHANMANVAFQATNHPLPLWHLTQEQREMLRQVSLRQSLSVLEKLVSSSAGHLESPIEMEFNGLLGKSLSPGTRIQRAWRDFSSAEIRGVIVQVRSRLLDFCLEIKPNLVDDESTNTVKTTTDMNGTKAIFQDAIFGNNANVTIQMGAGNNQSVNVSSNPGDFDALAKELMNLKVAYAELAELKAAIDADHGFEVAVRKEFGPNVKSWIKKMLCKASEASWQIELNIAAGILTSKLQSFYGWLT